MRGTSRAIGILAAGVAMVSCGRAVAPIADGPLEDVLRVSCLADEIRVAQGAVRTHPDGVHVRVDAPDDEVRMLLIETGGSEPVPAGGLDLVTTAPPGELRMACLVPVEPGDPDELEGTDGTAWSYPADDEWATAVVIDEAGWWVDDLPSCEHYTGVHADFEWDFTGDDVPPGSRGDPVDLAAGDLPGEIGELGRSRPGDVLERAGYPEAEVALVRLVRDGQVVAVVRYVPDGHGGWHNRGVDYCEEEGPSTVEPSD